MPLIVEARVAGSVCDAALAAAATELESGRPIAVPTDTVYGLAARVTDPVAIQEMLVRKQRPAERRLAVLVSGVDQAAELVEIDAGARLVLARFWPGPLTVVLPRAAGAPPDVGDAATIGVRCPDEDFVRRLADVVGSLASTSANPHGAPTPGDAAAVAGAFPSLGLVIDGGRRSSVASTVVDLTGPEPIVVRPGATSAAEIAAVVAGRES
ncbi:MAG: L-threonylcarbamoyladenylate synthase [Acidimicrobiales bacterium]